MSQTNNNNNTDFTVAEVEDMKSFVPLARYKTIKGPRILTKDSDIYVLQCGKNNYVIKSWITNKPVANRRYNKETGYAEKIDPTLEEEDRRLLILAVDPTAILAEDYYKSIGYEY